MIVWEIDVAPTEERWKKNQLKKFGHMQGGGIGEKSIFYSF